MDASCDLGPARAAGEEQEAAVDCCEPADGHDAEAAGQPAACPGLDEAIQELQVRRLTQRATPIEGWTGRGRANVPFDLLFDPRTHPKQRTRTKQAKVEQAERLTRSIYLLGCDRPNGGTAEVRAACCCRCARRRRAAHVRICTAATAAATLITPPNTRPNTHAHTHIHTQKQQHP
jgi:hypothetical protein